MGPDNDVIATWVLALVCPAILFVTALGLRQALPHRSAPALTAERIVSWYAAHPQFALWVLLLLLPFSAFLLGSAALLRTWDENPQLEKYLWRVLSEIPEHWAAVSIGGGTLLAAGVLVMITAHLMTAPANRRRSVSS